MLCVHMEYYLSFTFEFVACCTLRFIFMFMRFTVLQDMMYTWSVVVFEIS
jgi:hypothetical protein